mgnify:CR=1 FL=1
MLVVEKGGLMPRQKTWSGQTMTVSDKPIISAKEARKILGKDYNNLSDEHIMGVVRALEKIAIHFLLNVKVPNNTKV